MSSCSSNPRCLFVSFPLHGLLCELHGHMFVVTREKGGEVASPLDLVTTSRGHAREGRGHRFRASGGVIQKDKGNCKKEKKVRMGLHLLSGSPLVFCFSFFLLCASPSSLWFRLLCALCFLSLSRAWSLVRGLVRVWSFLFSLCLFI